MLGTERSCMHPLQIEFTSLLYLQIIALLHESFQKVDRAYFSDHIGEALARRCALQMYPSGDENIEKYNAQINGFATAAVALLYDNRLFVANLGDSRYVLERA